MNIIGNPQGRIPDFMIVGAPKSGTTSLYYYLKQHPEIFMPEEKEPYFFCFMNNPPGFVSAANLSDKLWRLEDYLALFAPAKKNAILGEATPAYLYAHSTAIPNIRKVYGEAKKNLKIIIILRNPVDRAFSQYMMFRRDNFEDLEFQEAIRPDTVKRRLGERWNYYYDYLGFGEYSRQVESYLNEFPHVRVYLYDEFKSDNLSVMRDMFEFIGVSSDFVPETRLAYNPSGEPRLKRLHKFLFLERSPLKEIVKRFLPWEMRMKIKYRILDANIKSKRLDAATRKKLHAYFEDDIIRLESVLGRDLSLWRQDG